MNKESKGKSVKREGLILWVVTFILYAYTLFSYSPGTKSGEFLKIDTSGFSRALGGNEINFSDASCFVNNPALSAFILKGEVSLSQLNWFEGTDFLNFSYFFPISFLTFGINYSLFKVDEIQSYDFNRQYMGKYTLNNEIFIFSLSTKKKNLCFGLNFKKIKEDLIDLKGKGTLYDFSLSYIKKLFRFSIVMKNMGNGITYEGIKEKVSNGMILGLNLNLKNFEFYTTYNIFTEENNWYKLGLRYKLSNSMYILSGINNRDDSLSTFSFGLEFDFSKFKLLYYYQGSNIFSDASSFSLSYRFGPTKVKYIIYRRAKKLYKLGRIRNAKEEVDKLLIIEPNWKKAKKLKEKIIRILKSYSPEEAQ